VEVVIGIDVSDDFSDTGAGIDDTVCVENNTDGVSG
jgi:hypothetical protein